ncbi:hypothetical protein EB796_005942 [Bugula neritina]|uniref:Uncharacterized protein n=1 Tax=Bugula neritina TaxID=10212 RepID=A0A7J7KAS6_BUGNE|nr:hypothetical protein EB796_005942 [Bugula neritina]
MSVEEVWEKQIDYITDGDVDKFKETMTSLSPEDRLKVLCMQNFISYQGKTIFSTTVLHIAAEGGHTETVKCILDSVPAADLYKLLSIQNRNGYTAVHSAAERGHTKTVKCILDSVPAADLHKLLNIKNRDGNTAVHRAVKGSHTETVKCILDSVPAADLHKLLSIQNIFFGDTAVHSAAERGHTETVKCILDSVPGADLYKLLSIQNIYSDNTAVHSAAERGHTETVKCILDSVPAADLHKLLSIQSKYGDTAVDRAAERGDTETVKCILDSVPAADLYKLLSIQNRSGNTAVHRAAERGHTETVKCILDSVPAADLYKLLSIQNEYGNTAVHRAAKRGHTETHKKNASDPYATRELIPFKGQALELELDLRFQSAATTDSVTGPKERKRRSAKFSNKKKPSPSIADSGFESHATAGSITGIEEQQERIGDVRISNENRKTYQKQGKMAASLSDERPVILNPVTEELSPDAPYEPAPEFLLDAIESLLDSHNISDVTFGQFAADWRKILVLGKNVLRIQSDLQTYLHSESLTKFEITLKNNNNPFTMKSLSWEKVLTINKKKVAKKEKLWGDSVKQTVCEAFVIAERKCANNNMSCKRVYAVAPAHLVLADKQNEEAAAADSFYMKQTTMQDYRTELNSRQLAGPPKKPDLANGQTNQTQNEQDHDDVRDVDSDDENLSLVSKVRTEVESKSTRRQYFIRTEDEHAASIVELQHPVLLGYRHWYKQVESTLSSSNTTSECPELKCDTTSAPHCPHRFMNDLALLLIAHKHAKSFQSTLDSKTQIFFEKLTSSNVNGAVRQGTLISKELLQLSTVLDLQQLAGREVMVKGMLGRVVNIRLKAKPGQRLGQHIKFTLTSPDTESAEQHLIRGDCGSLVYVECEGVLRPVGMLVGEAIISDNTTPAGPIYQAVVLSQAFKNMECDYPHQVSNIELFSQDRYSQLDDS